MKIKLSENAKTELDKMIEKDARPFRIAISVYNCGGPVFNLGQDNKKENDEEIEVDGIKFIAEDEILSLYKEFYVEYSDSWRRRGFTITFGEDDKVSSC